ncbi:MAG TPA: hypothetical protein VIS74_01620, partial [Chthoniobacterales bacterium]
EFYDPTVPWTDRCPLPVLAGVVWFGFAALTSLAVAIFGPAVLPVFGVFVIGWPAQLLIGASALLWIYGAGAFYRLDRKGWWVIAIGLLVFVVSSAITYACADILEIYPKLGYSPEQVAQIAKFNFVKGALGVGFVVLWAVPVFGYLFYVRKFFPGIRPEAAGS